MTNKEQLVERHIREHEARLKHIDELMESADAALSGSQTDDELSSELDSLKHDREKLYTSLEELREKSAIAWTEKGGPMVMWDVVAARLENLLEKVEHWKTRH